MIVGTTNSRIVEIGQTTERGEPEGGSPRKAISPTTLKRRLMIADALAVLTGIILAFAIQSIVKPLPNFVVFNHIALSLSMFPGFVIGAAFNHLYQARANERPGKEAHNVLNTVVVGAGTLVLVAFGMQYKDLSRLWVVLVTAGVAVAVLIERRSARYVFAHLRAERRILRRIVIVGTDAHAIGLLHTYARNPEFGYEVVGFVGSEDIGTRGGVRLLGPLGDLEQILCDHEVCGVVVSLASIEARDVNILARRLTDAGYHVALSSTLRDIDVTRLRPQQLDGRTMIYIEPVLRDGWRAMAKRIFDLTVASLVIVVSLPVTIVAMPLIKFSSPGGIFFSQVRVGRDGREFKILKFRTMVIDAEERKGELAALNESDGPLFKIAHDPRVTRIGGILRKLSIDELPQLLNVITGSMSLVGPRPALPSEVLEWDDEVRDRLRVLPGLTGMWQVSGRSDSSFEQYKRMDLYYVDNWSLAHDLRICWRTVPVVFSGSGAS